MDAESQDPQPTTFRLRRGEFEVEVAGSRGFVESQLDRWLDRWLAMAEGGTPAPESTAVIRVATSPAAARPSRVDTKDAHTDEVTFPRVSPDFQPKVNVSIGQFVAMKDAVVPADVFIVGVYYLEKYHRRETFTQEELQALLAPLPAWECHRVEDVLEEVLVRGHVERLRDGTLSITFKGQNYVREGLA